jgi:hypothetical protein
MSINPLDLLYATREMKKIFNHFKREGIIIG